MCRVERRPLSQPVVAATKQRRKHAAQFKSRQVLQSTSNDIEAFGSFSSISSTRSGGACFSSRRFHFLCEWCQSLSTRYQVVQIAIGEQPSRRSKTIRIFNFVVAEWRSSCRNGRGNPQYTLSNKSRGQRLFRNETKPQ